MIECGRVRSELTCQGTRPRPGTSTSIVATHHASRMVARSAPARIAIRSASPVLVGTLTARSSGPRKNVRTS